MKTNNILLLSLTTATLIFAAPPTIGDIEKQVQPPREIEKGIKNAIPILPASEIKPVMKEIGGKSVEVKGFTFSGNIHISNEILQTLVSPYISKSYTLAELEKISSLITKKYRDEGYFVARAYIPKQSIVDGILEIAIIEGNYGEFQLTNTSLVSNERVQGMLDDIKDTNIISVNTLERAMLVINDTPGAKVTAADVMPGSKVGTSDFAINTEATNPYSAYIIGDNYGSKYTGRYRVNVGLSANSPLGYGDKLSLNGVISTTSDLKNGKIAYGFPLMDNGLRGELSASRTTYSLAEEYASLDAFGTLTTLEATLSYPIIRTRQESLHTTLSYAHKNMTDEVTTVKTKKDADAVALGLNYNRSCMFFDLPSTITANLNLTHGNLSFNNADALALDEAGAQTNGDYTKVSGSIEKALQLDPTYSLTTSLRFQKTLGNKNLDGSEDFSVGGVYGVRAFPDGELSAENGYILGAELFYSLPSYEGINHRSSLFADTGYAKMENPLTETKSRQLSDIGLGYQASYKEFFAKAQIARVFGGEQVTSETPSHNTRLLLQLGWIY